MTSLLSYLLKIWGTIPQKLSFPGFEQFMDRSSCPKPVQILFRYCSNTVLLFKNCPNNVQLLKYCSNNVQYCPDRVSRTKTGLQQFLNRFWTVFEQVLNSFWTGVNLCGKSAQILLKYCSYTVHRFYCNQNRIRTVLRQVLDRFWTGAPVHKLFKSWTGQFLWVWRLFI